MEHLIYILDSSPQRMLKEEEGTIVTDNEMEAIIYPTKEDALAVIDTLSGTTEFWGTRKPRPRDR